MKSTAAILMVFGLLVSVFFVPLSADAANQGIITGTVTDGSMGAVYNAGVDLYRNSSYLSTVYTDATGAYEATGLQKGNYTVYFADYYARGLIGGWYSDKDGVAIKFYVNDNSTDVDATLYEQPVVANFPGSGLYYYKHNTWAQISGASCQAMGYFTANEGNETTVKAVNYLAADFGASGLYVTKKLKQSMAASDWVQISAADPKSSMAHFNYDTTAGHDGNATLVVNFGPSWGLYVTKDFAKPAWKNISGVCPDAMLTWSNNPTNKAKLWDGNATLVVDFGASGLWALRKDDFFKSDVSTKWINLSAVNPGAIAKATLADGNTTLLASFPGWGLGITKYMHQTGWVKISGVAPDKIVSVTGRIFVDFGASGLWMTDDPYDAEAWVQISALNPSNIEVVGTGTNSWHLYADFGANGLWTVYGNGAPYSGKEWSVISGAKPDALVKLTNGSKSPPAISNSFEALYVDFGASGFWKWDGYDWNWSDLSLVNPGAIQIVNE